MAPELRPGTGPARVVAHLHHAFFERTETFIHTTVTGLKRFRPILLAWEFKNLDAFPVPSGSCFTLGAPRWSAEWLAGALARRLLRRELRAEGVVRRERAALLHAHFGPSGVLAMRVRRPAGLPLVTTFYGNDLSLPRRDPVWRQRYRELFERGALFLVEGAFMGAALRELGCPEEKIAVQRIAIPVGSHRFRERRPRRVGERIVALFAGRLVEKKGLPVALAAVRDVRARFPELELRVVGDGPQRAEVEALLDRWALRDSVRLLGFLNHAEYLAELERADLLLQPSLTAADGDSEGGAPTTLLEAQALGVPIVSTTHADIPNVVGDGALLAPEGDAAAFAANLARSLADQASWGAIGAAGRRFVEAHHDVGTEIPRLEAHYERLAGLPPDGAGQGEGGA